MGDMGSVECPEFFWQRDDLFFTDTLTPRLETVNALRRERQQWLMRDCWRHARQALANLPAPDSPDGWTRNLSEDVVSVEGPALPASQSERIRAAARALHPWRKGPFRLWDVEIDAEWRSNLKWARIANALGDLSGQRILDAGCGNGYYMFRAAAANPALILGLDPSVAFRFQFEFLQHYLQCPRLQYEMLGVEHLDLFSRSFDWSLCMGVIYHQRHPLQLLSGLLQTLTVGGRCLLESQTLPGGGSLALFPPGRYAKARNVYFVPTAECLVHWMQKAGFVDVELVSHEPVTTAEQRRTEWMEFESLDDFLDPQDAQRTIEGHPAPWRTAVVGTRGK